MKRLAGMTVALALCVGAAGASSQLWAAESAQKNWTPPATKIYAQQLAEETMAQHPELLSMTFHGVPPGLNEVYTMFAGSYPDRVGNPDDPDDIDVSKKGITILDPRWHKTKDKNRKFVVLMPLRDAAGENVGLVVYAFRDPVNPSTSETERETLAKATALRDALAKRISSYPVLFDAAK